MPRIKTAILKFLDSMIARFRARRMSRFIALFSPDENTTILDVGGSPHFWNGQPIKAAIILVNIDCSELKPSQSPYPSIVADGRRLPFADDSLDIAFSNSVIEHLRTYQNQQQFAEAIRRVSRRIWVQTPARYFPFEPHVRGPFIHYLPVSLQRRMIRNFTIWGLIARPTQGEVDAFLDEVRLLTYRDMKNLFPDCHIIRERFLFLTKSYIAVRI